MENFSLIKRFLSEALGTMGLLTAVIGSGIMAERLADGNVAIALMGNTFPRVVKKLQLIEISLFYPTQNHA